MAKKDKTAVDKTDQPKKGFVTLVWPHSTAPAGTQSFFYGIAAIANGAGIFEATVDEARAEIELNRDNPHKFMIKP